MTTAARTGVGASVPWQSDRHRARAPDLSIEVLGPLVVRHGGLVLEVSGARRRALLALLALAGGRPVPVARIVDVLGDGDPADHAVATLRTYMSKLRADLGPAAGALRTVDGGYLLDAPPGAVDAVRLRELVVAARSGAAHDRLDLASEALALWRGDPLPELVDTRWGQAEAVALTDLWIEATSIWANAKLELGDTAAAAGALRDLLREHPHREDLAADYMLALYRSARQSEALAYYPLIRQRLSEDLGIEPSPGLTEVYSAILTHAPDLDPPVEPEVPGRSTSDTAITGRDDELAALVAAWEEVRASGRPRVAVLTGEAGIGKTRLATELGDLVRAQGGVVLRGRACERPAPYEPIAECLAEYVARLAPALVASRLGPGARELVRLVPDLADHLAEPSPDESMPSLGRRRLARAVDGWWQAATRAQPLVLLLDDLEHLDEETALLLRDAVSMSSEARVMILACLRDTDLPDGHPARMLVSALRRRERLLLTPVGPLGVQAIKALAEAAKVSAEPERLATETGGNAFFVTQWLAALAARETSVTRGARAGIDELVRERLSRLHPTTVELLMAAAVVGEVARLESVTAVGSIDPRVAAEHLSEAVQAHLLEECGQGVYRFIHGMVREALLDRLGPTRAADAHRRVAEHLERAASPFSDVALHAIARHHAAGVVDGGDATRAIAFGVRAGQVASSRLAHQVAHQCYDDAIAAASRGRRHGTPAESRAVTELLLLHGEVSSGLGVHHDPHELLVVADRASAAGDAATFVRAALALSRRRIHGGAVDEARLRVLRGALASPGTDERARALLLTGVAAELGAYEPHAVLDEVNEAWELAERLDDDTVRARVLTVRNLIVSEVSDAQTWFEETTEHLAVARRLGDPLAACEATTNRLVAALCIGDHDEATGSLVEVERLANDLGGADQLFWAGISQAVVLLQDGRADAAEESARAALELGREAAIAEAEVTFEATLHGIRFEQGRLDELVPQLREPAGLEAPGRRRTAALVHALSVTGAEEEAREALRSAREAGFAHLRSGRFALVELACLTAAAARLGDVETAAALSPVLATWSPRFVFGGGAVWGHVHHHLGVLLSLQGDPRAEWLLRSGEQAHRDARAPAWVARSLAHLGDHDEADEIAARLGLGGLAAEVRLLRG